MWDIHGSARAIQDDDSGLDRQAIWLKAHKNRTSIPATPIC